MKFLAVVLALLGAASAGLLPATLLPKVNIAPTQVNIVKQPVHVTETEVVYRSVPEPVRAVAYTAPIVTAPAVALAPAVVAGLAITAHTIAAPAVLAHSIW